MSVPLALIALALIVLVLVASIALGVPFAFAVVWSIARASPAGGRAAQPCTAPGP